MQKTFYLISFNSTFRHTIGIDYKAYFSIEMATDFKEEYDRGGLGLLIFAQMKIVSLFLS